jgi:hypothetical protein
LELGLKGHEKGGSRVVTMTLPLPPEAPKDWLVGEMENPHESENVMFTDPRLSP